jgi:hypothetical protein
MLKHFAIVMAFAGLSLLGAACANNVPVPETPQFHFTAAPPYVVPGAKILIENAYVPPASLPSVENAYQTTPADIARAWARDRLRAKGDQGRVVMRILEASVAEDTLPTQHGFVGYLAGEQNRQFTARLKADILFYGDPRETSPGRVSVEVSASRPVAGNAGPRGAEVDYYALLEQIARDFDGALSQQMGVYLARE